MSSNNCYDVTTWPVGNPSEDVGEVINSIIADIKDRQTVTDAKRRKARRGDLHSARGLPPSHAGGDRRQLPQDPGSGHGFTSSSIRFNVPEDEWPDLHELWPGGSRILVDIPLGGDGEESKGAAFYVERSGSPRISSVEFSNFCIDGLHFNADGSGMHPENTYVNGKTGIYVANANDSFRVNRHGVRLP